MSAALSTANPTGPTQVHDVFLTSSAQERFAGLVTDAVQAGVRITLVTDDAAAGLSETVTPQGIVAVCTVPPADLGSILAARPRLVAVLDEVRDPGNAGSMLRTAHAVGADGVVLAGDCVDPYNGKSVRASAGAVFHLPVARGVTLAAATGELRRAGLRVLAADGSADVDLDTLDDAGGLAGPTAWLFGNEAHGLPAAASADVRVRIAMTGGAESLNVGAAAAICLYASARAHRGGHPHQGRGRQG